MALVTKIRHNSTSDVITLPHTWVEWLTREGYSTQQVDMQIRENGEIVLMPVRDAPAAPESP